MTSAAVVALFVLIGITGSAMLAFWWAAQDGQFENVKEGSRTVFDKDEREALAHRRVDEKGNVNGEGRDYVSD
jgi:cbb3-type cytochrome oxidase maturation protein